MEGRCRGPWWDGWSRAPGQVCPPLSPSCATHRDFSWQARLNEADPTVGHLAPATGSSAWPRTYVESLLPQGRRVGRALVVGGEALVHRGGLVDAAGCRGLVILVEGAVEESREVRGASQDRRSRPCSAVSRRVLDITPVVAFQNCSQVLGWVKAQGRPAVGPQPCHALPAKPAGVLTSRSPPG